MTQKGFLCSGSPGKKSIDTLEDCQDAVSFVQAILPNTEDSVTEEEESDYPKGCYLSKNNQMHFNTAANGSSHENAREICIPGM